MLEKNSKKLTKFPCMIHNSEVFSILTVDCIYEKFIPFILSQAL